MRRLIAMTLLSASALAVAACHRNAPSPAQGAGARGPTGPRPVVVEHPVAARFPRTLRLHGTLDPLEQVQIVARVEGPLLLVRGDMGDPVRRGATLARIGADVYRAQHAEAEATLTQAQSDLARYEGLGNSDAVPRQAFDQARTRVATSEAELALASRSLRDTLVRAPFDGAIARRYVSVGAYVRVGTPLFDVVTVDALRLALEVPERNLRDVHEGAEISVQPDGAEGEAIRAPIVRVSPVVTPATRTFRVEAQVDSHAGAMRPGMFVVGTIDLGMDESAVRLPRGAVYSVLGHDRVTLVVDGRATPRDVELLGEADGAAFVHGLSPSDVVVVRGPATLAPGTPVRASVPERTAAAEPAERTGATGAAAPAAERTR